MKPHSCKTESISKGRRRNLLTRLTALRLLGLLLVGCQASPQEPAEPAPAEEQQAQEQPDLIEGWNCDTITTCLGLSDGRKRIFHRSVGARSGQEIWELQRGSTDQEGVSVFNQAGGGPATYEVHQRQVAVEYRGELLEAYRFPLQTGDTFDVVGVSGQTVRMSILSTNETAETPAGEFGPCLVHRAAFINEEEPDKGGLTVTTKVCNGIGEVAQTVELPAMPNHVELTLFASDTS